MTRVQVQAFTDVGLVRARNEDAVLVAGWLSQTHTGVLTAIEVPVVGPVVCAVADGMGGHAGGNLASSMALSILGGLTDAWNTGEDISGAMTYVNDQIRSVGDDPELHGLGTTVAGICITDSRIIAFNLGDSRIYTIDEGFLQQISIDDSVHDAQGNTTNLVTQSLGQQAPIEPHIIELSLRPAAFLICSDGVSGVMSAAELRAAVLNADAGVCADMIIDDTRAGGAADNFSFLLVRVTEVSDERTVAADPATAEN
ncbi:protein phosphatase 2C domain-containing protein [Mycobacterium sp. ITM-2016-00316]|uniref:PP2C family protein-serine/threonine phosphatase n=1 Tax=Mycobacterium sp. ITM-2016-00316 TaxID=2099695 RepID=UPI000CF92381|nr:protein phosphatase 2C domain-containing protein [Mycobacterium sp. ITM-2016-00316]WNG81151.1 protein phosphatase 2C domain-containing protein [Mycobacterium sp. ITM-2016-00316]